MFFVIREIWKLYYKRRILSVADLKIGKKKFVQTVLEWCVQNIGSNNKHFNLKIIYRKPTKRMGYYQFWNNEIVIYIHDPIELYELIDTVIHEYTHHLQMPTKKTSKEYYDKLLSYGYENHPMEIEARNLAKKYRNQCYDEIIKKVV